MPINNKYYVKLEVLTPLCVGAGAEYDYPKAAGYIEDNGKIYFLNLSKMAKAGIDLNKLSSYISQQNDVAVKSLIGNKLQCVCDREMPSTASTDNPIKAIIRNQLTGNPLIPGSSVKGAIRSHIFKSLGGDKNSKDDNLFGSLKEGENMMRFVKISDFEFKDCSIVNTKIFNLTWDGEDWNGGWKHSTEKTSSKFTPTGFNTIYEMLIPGQEAFGTLILTPMLFDRVSKGHVDNIKRNLLDINNLFLEINQHTIGYLEREREFFKTYNQADATDEIIDSIDDILYKIPTDGQSCIFKMAAGAGFHSITGDWQFDDYLDDYTGDYKEMGRKPRIRNSEEERVRAQNARPKSRKIAIHDGKKSLMGFVKLTIVDAEQAKLAFDSWHERIQNQLEDIKQETELIKIGAEKRKKYESLISEVRAAIDTNTIDKAKELIDKAIDILPDGELHEALLAEIKQLDRTAKEQKAAELKAKGIDAENSGDYESALKCYKEANSLVPSECLDHIGRCENIIKRSKQTNDDFIAALRILSIKAFIGKCKKHTEAGHSFTIDDFDALADKIVSNLQEANKNTKKDWLREGPWKNELPPILGDDLAAQLYQRIHTVLE